jgi:hypothetical protein
METLNNKPLVGVISSRIPKVYFKSVIKQYVDRGITSFIVDMDGRGLNTNIAWFRGLVTTMKKEYDLFENSFLYIINAGEGRFKKENPETQAKDFITCFYGMDILGQYHISPKHAPPEDTEKKYKIFNSESYGYSRVPESEFKKLHGDYSYSKLNSIRKEENIRRQLSETEHLKTLLSESESVGEYISSKSQIDDDTVKGIKSVRKSLKL